MSKINNTIQKQKVLKVSGISGYNTGDCIISRVIEHLFSDTEFELCSYHISVRQKAVPLRVLVENIWLSGTSQLTTTEKLKTLIKKIIIKKINIVVYVVNILNVYVYDLPVFRKISKKHAFLVIGGGNLLFNKKGTPYLFVSVLLTKLFKRKKIVFYAVGVGPFSYPFKKQLQNILKYSSLVTVRDSYSLKYFPADNKVVKTLDPAILLSDINPLADVREKKYLGINLMDFKYSNEFNYQNVELTSNNLIKIADKLKLKILLLTSSLADLLFAKNVFTLINDQRIGLVEHRYLYPDVNMADYFNEVAFFISHRMHPSLFALSYEIPNLIFPWQGKIESYVKDIYGEKQMKDILLNDLNFDLDEVSNKLNNVNLIQYDDIVVTAKQQIYKDFNMIISAFKQ